MIDIMKQRREQKTNEESQQLPIKFRTNIRKKEKTFHFFFQLIQDHLHIGGNNFSFTSLKSRCFNGLSPPKLVIRFP